MHPEDLSTADQPTAAASAREDNPTTVADRLEKLDRHGLPRSALVALFVTFFFANYDISVFAFVIPTVTDEYDFTTAEAAIPVTINLIGYAVGAYAIGALADRFGRRAGLFTTAAVLALSGVLTAVSWGPWSFAIFRGICGMGTGALLSLGATYLSELMPAKRRGMSMNVIMLGVAIVSLAAGLASPTLVSSVPGGWRIITGFAVLAAIALPIFMNRRLFPESPRWLARRGRLDEASTVLSTLEERAWRRGSPRPSIAPARLLVADEEATEFGIRSLWSDPETRRRLILITGFWLLLYFSDYVFLSYSTVIFEELGASPSGALWLTAVTRLGQVIVAVAFLFAIERFERKWLTAAGTLVMTAGYGCMLIPGTFALTTGGLMTKFGISMIAVPGWTYTAEIFPSHGRATAAAIGDGAGHLGGALQPFVFLPLLGVVGIHWTMSVFIVTAILAAVIISLGPKTRGRELSAIGAS